MLNPDTILKVLHWAYDAALAGLPGAESATELADDYLGKNATSDEAIDSLIRWQVSKSVATGFITGLGGAITLPVAIPTSLASSRYVQVRMAGRAAKRVFSVRDDQAGVSPG